MSFVNRYEFKVLDRMRSICVIPKDDIFIVFNSEDNIQFSLKYPKYIYINCNIETSNEIVKFELNSSGC